MSARVSKPAPRPPAVSRRSFTAVLLAAGLALAPQLAAALDIYQSAEHRIAALETGIAPELYGSTVLLAHQPSRLARYVAMRFSGDPTLHVYGRRIRRTESPSGTTSLTVFVLTIDLSKVALPDDGRLLYRITVDGLWMADPNNPVRVVDPVARLEWSVIEVNPRDVKPPQSPEWIGGGVVRFHYLGEPGRSVALVGDFNRWDPYMHALAEISPGDYRVDLKIPPGTGFYVFLVDGVWTTDPLNPRRGLDVWGRRVCVVPPAPMTAR